MQYITLGKEKDKISRLGFGCMRFPTIGGDKMKINEEKATKLLNYAYDNGINYYDTAYPYHSNGFDGKGKSEAFLGRFIKDKRDSVYIATKMPSWTITIENDLNRIFDDQLKTLQVDYIDYYMLHSLTSSYYKNLKSLNVFDFLERKVAEGNIRNIGFSFHDTNLVFTDIINDYDWDFCQIQYNFLDTNYQAGTKGLDLAYEKNIDVIVMEPLRGGKLLALNDDAKNLFKGLNKDRTIADWAFSWLYTNKKIALVLSGMTAMDNVVENINIVNASENNPLSDYDYDVIGKVSKIIQNSTRIDCTACGYCLPCPYGVEIPSCFSCYNNYHLFGDNEGAKKSAVVQYSLRLKEESYASNCTDCKLCESHCPQNIEISAELKKIVEIFE